LIFTQDVLKDSEKALSTNPTATKEICEKIKSVKEMIRLLQEKT